MTSGWRQTPLGRLIEHFFSRFFESSAVMRDPHDRMGIAPVLGLLAVPGVIMSLILFLKYSPMLRWFKKDWAFDTYLAAIPDKYTFIVFSMAGTGIFAVLKWESLFPDRRDFANLAPLPLPTSTIFFAKLSALVLFALVFAVDINIASSILFPAIAMESYGTFSELLRFIAAHAASVVAASTFAFCAFIAVAGFLMNVLPYAAFRRTARYLQFVVVTSLVLMFLLTPLATSGLMRVRAGADTPLAWLPPVWFLALSETWHGKATPAFQALGTNALRALAAVFAIAAISYVGAYRRYFLKSAETPEIVGSVRGLPQWIWRALDNSLLRSPFDRGCFRFAAKTLFRSDRHNTVLAACLGVGAALATTFAAARGTALHVSGLLTLVYFLVTGLRLSFGIAQEERANWAFQVAVCDPNPNARGVVRKFILTAVAVLVIASIPLYAIGSGFGVACVHAAFAFTNAVLLTEIVLLNFRSIPFTCTYLPSKDNFVAGIAVFGVGLVVFADLASLFERWLLLHPTAVIGYAVFIVACLFALHVARETNLPVEYEQRTGTLELLRLSE
jgi:hypothetical protein